MGRHGPNHQAVRTIRLYSEDGQLISEYRLNECGKFKPVDEPKPRKRKSSFSRRHLRQSLVESKIKKISSPTQLTESQTNFSILDLPIHQSDETDFAKLFLDADPTLFTF